MIGIREAWENAQRASTLNVLKYNNNNNNSTNNNNNYNNCYINYLLQRRSGFCSTFSFVFHLFFDQ